MKLRERWRALRQALRVERGRDFDDGLGDMESMIAPLTPKAPMLAWVHTLPKAPLEGGPGGESRGLPATLDALVSSRP